MIADESKKVRNIPGSAQRSLRGTSVFYTNDSCSVGQELPLAATGLLDMFTIVLAGKNKSTASQLKRLVGARKHMVRDLIEYIQDKDGSLVNGFCLARKASVGKTNLDTYSSDGSAPQELLDAALNPQDPNNLRGRASSSSSNDRREREAMDEDEVSSDGWVQGAVIRKMTRAKAAGNISTMRTRSLIRLKTL